MNLLNRNIENVAVVGQGFEPVHTLWTQFESVMANASVRQSSPPTPETFERTFETFST